MNSNVYYKFELHSREEYYRKNKQIFDVIYNDDFVIKYHSLIVSKGAFAFINSLASIYCLKFLLKNNYDLKLVGKNFGKIIFIGIFNANLLLRNFKKEYPFDNKSEANQNYFIIFSKSLVNHNFCLAKDLYLILFLYNLKFLLNKSNKNVNLIGIEENNDRNRNTKLEEIEALSQENPSLNEKI